MTKGKILLLMCHWIGDTFWAVQIIPELRKYFPEAELWAGIKPWSKDLLFGLIENDRMLILKNITSDRHREKFLFSDYIKELKAVRKEKFDTVIDLTCNRYSSLFCCLAGIKKRIGLKQHGLFFLYTQKGDAFPESLHFYQRPWMTLKILFPHIAIPQELFPPETKELQSSAMTGEFKKLALLVPGAGWKEKEWGIDNFAQCGKFLIDKGYRLILSGSEKERALCEELKNKLDNQALVFIKSLSEFIGFLPNISIAITNDSGSAHLIASFQKTLITIFKVENYDRYRPIGESVKVIRPTEASAENVINYMKTIIS